MAYLCYRFTTPVSEDPEAPPPVDPEMFWVSGPSKTQVEEHVATVLERPGPYDVLTMSIGDVFYTVVKINGQRKRLLPIFNTALSTNQFGCTLLAEEPWYDAPPEEG